MYRLEVPRRPKTLGGLRLKNAWKAQHLRRVSFKEACNAKTLGGCRLNVQIDCFGKVLEHFGPKAAQMLQMVSFGTIFDDFRPKAPQILQMVSFGTSLVHFIN